MRFIIKEGTPCQTVKEYLKSELKLSSKTVSLLKRRENGILLDGVPVTVAARLAPPCCIDLACEDTPEDENPYLIPEDIPLNVLYEDDSIVVVNKSPDMPTHPSMGHHTGTLANALGYRYRSRPFVFRSVNRLDRGTSGVTLCALDRIAAAHYTRLLVKGCFRKTYLALVAGEAPLRGTVDFSIRRADSTVIKRETCSEDADGAESARTEFERLATNGEMSVLRVVPHTGRTHQIRVHLSSIGHPILGDWLYGSADSMLTRPALHALSLEIVNGEESQRFCAPVPHDMQKRILADLPDFNMEELT